MTRQEQIVEAAEKFAGVNYDCESEADAFYHAVQKEAFVAGAAYADEHPDLYSVTREAIEREREYLIDKIAGWLQENIDYYAYNKDFISVDEFIKSFKKAMEE